MTGERENTFRSKKLFSLEKKKIRFCYFGSMVLWNERIITDGHQGSVCCLFSLVIITKLIEKIRVSENKKQTIVRGAIQVSTRNDVSSYIYYI